MAKNDQPADAKKPGVRGAGKSSGVITSAENDRAGSVPGLEVTSSRDGFRRAGRIWTKQPTVVLCSDLTREQAEQIIHEPVLVARPVYVPQQQAGSPLTNMVDYFMAQLGEPQPQDEQPGPQQNPAEQAEQDQAESQGAGSAKEGESQ